MVVGTRVDMGRTYRTGSFLSLTSEDSQVGTAYWRWMVAYLHYRGEELNRHDTKHVLQQHYSDSMHRYPECPIHPCGCDHLEHVVQQVLHNIHVFTIYSCRELSSIPAKYGLDEGEGLFSRVVVQ